ncbi:MAG: PhzF family phenazine biosynthesis protein [Chlamydiales bacterium]|nr:PhzF family phenazine biosynthesis protein [Chlamydiales bacterium]
MSQEQTELRTDMECNVYIVRAFCRDSLGGNLAGVVLEQGLTTEQMQMIAKELNFSETVFLSKIGPTLYKALYFTPSSSIDFCGHATIAAFGVLKQIDHLKNAVYQVETSVGLCAVTLNDSLIFLSQPLPLFGEVVPIEEVASVLGISVSDIQLTHLSPQIVSTGLRDIFVPVVTQDCLFAIQPNYEQITKLSEKYDAVGLHVFALEDSGKATTAFCRNFAPRYGIPEESATGSSNGALGCYLFEQDILSSSERQALLFKQGDLLNAPSNIYVHLITKDRKIERVECGGEIIIDEIRILQLK